MSWLAWIGFAVILTGTAAVTGIKAKGTRHVAHTRLMGIARLILWSVAIVLIYQAWRTYSLR